MKILVVTNVYPNSLIPTKGTFNLEMVRGLSESHEMFVLSPVPWPTSCKATLTLRKLTEVEQLPGVAVRYPVFYYTPRLLRQHYGDFLWWSTRRTLANVCAKFQPDVILSYWAHPDGEVAVRAARSIGVPAVAMVGGSDVLLLTQDSSRRKEVQAVLRSADAVITISKDIKSKVESLGVPCERVHCVNRGVDRRRFVPGSSSEARARLGVPAVEQMLLWTGRMVPVKGLGTLLSACTRLNLERSCWSLYLVGDGEERAKLERHCGELGLGSNVKFVGAVAHGKLSDWYRAADLVVLPSLSEGIPNVLLEALACGKRFVASDVGGIPEIADDRFDILVEPDHPEELAKAIKEALNRPPVSMEQRAFVPQGSSNFVNAVSAILTSVCINYSSTNPSLLQVA